MEMMTTEDELFQDVKYWKARADEAEANGIVVPDRYYGFWPDERRAEVVAALREIVEKYDIQTSFGAEAACEQLWNAMTGIRDD